MKHLVTFLITVFIAHSQANSSMNLDTKLAVADFLGLLNSPCMSILMAKKDPHKNDEEELDPFYTDVYTPADEGDVGAVYQGPGSGSGTPFGDYDTGGVGAVFFDSADDEVETDERGNLVDYGSGFRVPGVPTRRRGGTVYIDQGRNQGDGSFDSPGRGGGDYIGPVYIGKASKDDREWLPRQEAKSVDDREWWPREEAKSVDDREWWPRQEAKSVDDREWWPRQEAKSVDDREWLPRREARKRNYIPVDPRSRERAPQNTEVIGNSLRLPALNVNNKPVEKSIDTAQSGWQRGVNTTEIGGESFW